MFFYSEISILNFFHGQKTKFENFQSQKISILKIFRSQNLKILKIEKKNSILNFFHTQYSKKAKKGQTETQCCNMLQMFQNVLGGDGGDPKNP